jgi:hypothetical protein
MSFQIGSFPFIDSLLFLNASLDKLVSSMAKDGFDNFRSMRKQFPGTDLLFQKALSIRVYDRSLQIF